MHYIVEEDIDRIAFNIDLQKLQDKKIVVTGACGFIGYYIMSLLNAHYIECEVVGLDNFKLDRPEWSKDYSVSRCNVAHPSDEYYDADYIIHAASIASPTYYRKYPIETMEANVKGLWNILDSVYDSKQLKSLLFFSSSEIYGDPYEQYIPTKEDYNGNVSCNGPRSCYDESKRFGEALCMAYHREYNVPVKIVRPFNNYGPGLSINDKRVIPDFCKNILDGKDIHVLSDGTPTRTFCYIADAVTGYMKALLSEHNGEIFNIGNDKPELSIFQLANKMMQIGRESFGKPTNIKHTDSQDKNYNIDSPWRRCPDISKAREMLGYSPIVNIDTGIRKTLKWYCDNK